MLEAVEKTAIQTLDLVDRIYGLMTECQRALQEKSPKIYSKDLVELIFRSPFCRIGNLLATGMMASRITAKKHLTEMVRLGYLTEIKIGNELIYVNHALLTLLKRQ
jgi:Fic family protein